jgi:DNA-binding response OmpR family regulator
MRTFSSWFHCLLTQARFNWVIVLICLLKRGHPRSYLRVVCQLLTLADSPAMTLILIVEDEPKIAAFMQKGLKASGFSTHVVADGDRVLSRLLDSPYDLMMLDLGLPNQDGMDILKEMQERHINIPVIVATARSISPQDAQVLQMSGTKIFNKPFRMKDLIQNVRSLLEVV